MDNEYKRKKAKLAGKRARRRQIKRRLLLLAVLLATAGLVIGNRQGKSAEQAGNLLAGGVWQQEPEPEPDGEDDEAAAEPTGKKVVIDAGHGGKDQGCAYGDVLEKDINLAIARMLETRLNRVGIDVVMTRKDDTFVTLGGRVELAEQEVADAFVSIHVDAYPKDSSVNGVTVHCQKKAAGGRALADTLHDALLDGDFSSIRSVKESNLYVLRNTTMPAALVEVGFLTNKTDRGNLQSEDFLEELADGIASGIAAYLEENGDGAQY